LIWFGETKHEAGRAEPEATLWLPPRDSFAFILKRLTRSDPLCTLSNIPS
jgi:hypothetical protein